MRVLITGATGFVGSHLVTALAERGTEIRAIVRRTSRTEQLEAMGAELIEGGLEDHDALRSGVEGVDLVFHLAALTSARSEEEYFETNLGGTRRLLEAIREANEKPRRLIFLSSLAAVGPSSDGRPVTSTAPCRPITTYGRSKLAAEEACLAAESIIETVVLRPPAVYGPRDREILRFFRLAKMGVLPIPTGPGRSLQLVHVRDLAEAAVYAASTPEARGVYHIAEPRAYQWEEVAELFGRALARRVRILRVPGALITTAAMISETTARMMGGSTVFNREKARELLAPSWLCETDRMSEEIGFTPQISLAEGLAETAAWYRAEGWL